MWVFNNISVTFNVSLAYRANSATTWVQRRNAFNFLLAILLYFITLNKYIIYAGDYDYVTNMIPISI